MCRSQLLCLGPGRSLRLAPHLHVTDTDIDQLLDALTKVVQ